MPATVSTVVLRTSSPCSPTRRPDMRRVLHLSSDLPAGHTQASSEFEYGFEAVVSILLAALAVHTTDAGSSIRFDELSARGTLDAPVGTRYEVGAPSRLTRRKKHVLIVHPGCKQPTFPFETSTPAYCPCCVSAPSTYALVDDVDIDIDIDIDGA